MKIVKVDKKYSWLQWPVSMKGAASNVHVTAKFFGEVSINSTHVRYALRRDRELCTLNRDQVMQSTIWMPEVFGSSYVLELTAYPPTIFEVHHRFGLIRDDFEPYRPHITVSKEYWAKIKAGNLTPLDEELEFGELELYLGDKNG